MTSVNFYSKEQIDEREIGEPTDSASSTGSLWARIKNAVTRIVSLETADSNNVKKTGTSTVTGTLEVPTTPPTPTSAVNSVYVNDATAGVNNLMHKTGIETITGAKIMDGVGFQIEQQSAQGYLRAMILKSKHTTWTANNPPSSREYFPAIEIRDANDMVMGELRFALEADNTTHIEARVLNSNGTRKTVVLGKGDVI